MHKYIPKPEITILRLTVLMIILVIAIASISCSGGGGDDYNYSYTPPYSPEKPEIPDCERNYTADVKFGNRFTDKTTYVLLDDKNVVNIAPGDTSLPFTVSAWPPHTVEFRDSATNMLACQVGKYTFTACESTLITCGPN